MIYETSCLFLCDDSRSGVLCYYSLNCAKVIDHGTLIRLKQIRESPGLKTKKQELGIKMRLFTKKGMTLKDIILVLFLETRNVCLTLVI